MKLYKVQHIPTGLFFKPSNHQNKKNLSKTGKVYHSKPAIESWLSHCGRLSYTDYRKVKVTGWTCLMDEEYQVPTKLEDWKIIEIKVEESPRREREK